MTTFRILLLFILSGWLLAALGESHAQPGNVPPMGGSFPNMGTESNPNDVFSDSTQKNKKWENIPPIIHYKKYGSEIEYQIDTNYAGTHMLKHEHVWQYDLGNIGTPVKSFLFDESYGLGPQLHVPHYSPYLFKKENLPFYHTTRPYSLFSYSLGAQQEQTVGLSHTQNVHPRLNVGIEIKNQNSPGFFNNMLAVYNGGNMTANYISANQKYRALLGVLYNTVRHDENGGITHDSLLLEDRYVDSRQMPTNITSTASNRRRSKVYNQYKDFNAFLSHEYRLGVSDTVYNEDSTKYHVDFKPAWSFRHDMDIMTRSHSYFDRAPNANFYTVFDPDISILTNDTLEKRQAVYTFDNHFSVNGYIGRAGRQLHAEAGIGNRIDLVRNKTGYKEYDQTTLVNNYVSGKIQKEALEKDQWSYAGGAEFYFAGAHIGDFNIEAHISKYFNKIGAIRVYANQRLSSAPQNFTSYVTNYYTVNYDFSKIAQTHVSGTLNIEKIHTEVSLNNRLVYNYIYLNEHSEFIQYDKVVNVLSLDATHQLNFGRFYLKSQAFYQQKNEDAPVNVPNWGIVETIGYDNDVQNRMKLNIGLQFRYIPPYQRSGYNFVLNQFYYNPLSAESASNRIMSANPVELKAYANIRVKNMRLFIMADQIQQLLFKENVSYVPGYPYPRTMYRFGFRWTLYN